MKLTLYIGVLVYMYLSTSVAAQIGIKQVGTTSSFIIVLLSLYALTAYDINKTVAKYKAEFCIILLAFIIIVIKYFMRDFDGINSAIFFLIVPALFSILLGRQKVTVRINLRKIILLFFITECLLAIYERATLVNIFPYEELSEYYIVENLGFRSSAFLGHPLANAVCVSTIMGFVSISPMKLMQKMLLIVLGYLALLSFNARGAILVWTLLIVIYLFYFAHKDRRSEMFSLPMIVFFIASALSLYNMIVIQGFGDRFFQGELLDGSALTRLSVYGSFLYVSDYDLWFGNSASYLYVMDKLGAGGVENSFIVVMLNYGVIMAAFLFISYYYLMKRLLKPFSLVSKVFIITSFFIVGSMNNSLAGYTSWIFFILSTHAFMPQETTTKHNKHLESVYIS